MYVIPGLSDDLKAFAKNLGCVWLGAVEVELKPLCSELNCHTNVLRYVTTYGGERKIGYYFVQDLVSGRFEAILHSIVKKDDGQLIDITPFADGREYNIVGLTEKTHLDDISPHILE